LSRRIFVQTSLASGFAAGVGAQPERQGSGCLVWPAATPKTASTPANPIDLVKDLKVPVLGRYGGADPGIPIAQVEAKDGWNRLQAWFKDHGSPDHP
jgi:dienelactone hydrolase